MKRTFGKVLAWASLRYRIWVLHRRVDELKARAKSQGL